MAELFKNVYNEEFFEDYSRVLMQVIPNFNKEQFLLKIFINGWESKELKQRMRHVTEVLKGFLSSDFKESVVQLIKTIDIIEAQEVDNEDTLGKLAFIFMPDFIEVYGLNDLETSVAAFERITQFISCEFGVRPFIIKYEQKMLPVMFKWANHKDSRVRRLASEGSRPRLPWGMAIPSLKKDPTPILPILELLKSDPVEYVRRSVANNLNDISKDNPETVIAISKKWTGQSADIDWVVKHACRTLLKAGDSNVLQLFGFGSIEDIVVENFDLITKKVRVGEYLEFSFNLINNSSKKEKIRAEYGIYYLKKNGALSRKVFKISERNYNEKSTTIINRRQPFKIITTRKFHVGKHKVSLILNGVELDELKTFELLS